MARVPWNKLLARRKYKPIQVNADLAPEGAEPPKEKYGRKRMFNDGHTFDSGFESYCYDQLKLMVRAGELRDLRVKHRVYLTAARIGWNIDFSAINCHSGEREWYEAKGFETEIYVLKKRLWPAYGPGRLIILKGRAGKTRQEMYVAEVIAPRPVDNVGQHYPWRGADD